jgi:uncharacterized membrane protein YfcA
MIHPGAGGLAFIAVAALIAGAVNAVAGGGSLLSYPALLLAGFPPLLANITNTIGLVPGYAGGSVAYRAELRGQDSRIRRFGVIGGAGAMAGAFLLTRTASSLFQAVVPWLILAGCALNALQPLVAARSGDRPSRGKGAAHPVLGGAVFVLGVYGAFFGAGLGVVLLGLLGLFIDDHLQRLNALKGVLSLVFNTVAAVYFIAFATVGWEAVAVMVPASMAGGVAGVTVARRAPAPLLRTIVILVGVAVAIRLLV